MPTYSRSTPTPGAPCSGRSRTSIPTSWRLGGFPQKVEIVGMVETDDSLRDLDAAMRRWRALEHLQAAAYLYVPRGRGADARTLCLRETVRISDFRHYWFDGETLCLERCFA